MAIASIISSLLHPEEPALAGVSKDGLMVRDARRRAPHHEERWLPHRHCEPTGRANARPMTGSAKQSRGCEVITGLLRRGACHRARRRRDPVAPRNDDPKNRARGPGGTEGRARSEKEEVGAPPPFIRRQ